MLSIRSLEVGYNQQAILKDLTLQLVPGEVLGLIGPNGAGKTSLIRAISGVLPLSHGELIWNGESLAELDPRQRARLFAVVPQSPTFPRAFTVWEYVSLGRTPHLNWLGQLGRNDLDYIEWALASTDLSEFQERRTATLSGGELQRVVLARALAQDCPVLLLDEPTAHLDLHHQVAVHQIVRRLAAKRNLAVLVAMHDLNLAALYADRLALLVDGRLQAEGQPKDVLTSEHLQKAFRAPLSVHTRPDQDTPWVLINLN
jgi:iron complex transport system ATP-binding protein